MNKLTWKALPHNLIKIAWALFFITLPVTSFPFFPSDFGGRTLVRPLATYPLLILLILVTLPRFFKRPLPKTFLPLLAFIVVALISSVLSFSSNLESLRGVSVLSRFFRNIASLALGVSFYFTVSLLHETWDDLRFSLRWLYGGFSLALFWGTLQALYVVQFSPTYFNWMNRMQAFFSTRKLFTGRISGMTYEPKWFAEQICFLLLPCLIGSILTKRSLFNWRYKWITVEWLMLGWATVVLLFTFSRTGLLLLAGLTILGFLLFRSPRHPAAQDVAPKEKRRKINSQIVLEVILVVIGLAGVLFVVGSQNPYFSRFWRYWTEAKKRNRTYLSFIAVEQRFVYFETAYYIFEAYPVLGVGLGNYAFYFGEMLPDQLFYSPEIVRQTTPVEGRDRLITPKNLYARLLAETGSVGTATFIAFILAVIGCVLFLWLHPGPEQKLWGIIGFLGMIVFLVVGFSFDSFALPNMWIIFGLLTAAAHIQDPPDESSPGLEAAT